MPQPRGGAAAKYPGGRGKHLTAFFLSLRSELRNTLQKTRDLPQRWQRPHDVAVVRVHHFYSHTTDIQYLEKVPPENGMLVCKDLNSSLIGSLHY